MRAYLPRFEFGLDDLSGAGEDQLLNRELTPAAAVTLLLLKTAPGNPQILDELAARAARLRAVLDQPGGSEAFLAILTYIKEVSDAPASELRGLAASLGPDAEEAYVTIAEMHRAEGEARGRADALLEMLTVKFGSLPGGVTAMVRAASVGQIKGWAARAVTAETLDQVFN